MNLFNSVDSTSSLTDSSSGIAHFTWILDTGASFHMTGDPTLLVDIKSVDGASIHLPDGTVTRATQVGTLVLSDRLSLSNVLFVPQLKVNLISLYRILKDKSYVALLTDQLCIL